MAGLRVRVLRRSDGALQGLELQGHAGLAAAGNDVLCAAVSVTAEALGAGLVHLADAPAEIRADAGFYRVSLPEADLTNESELLFSQALLTLRSLARQYPERLALLDPDDPDV